MEYMKHSPVPAFIQNELIVDHLKKLKSKSA